MKIKNIKAREIIDSRGNPTVEVDVILEDNSLGRASVPSGASTGIYEAYELRDNDKSKYLGKGVSKAVNNVNTEIKDALLGKNPYNQKEIDNLLIKLDGTKNKSRLGANAILATSLAIAKASAISKNLELYEYLSENKKYSLPVPMMNILNGGAHASNNVDIQEFMIISTSHSSYQEGLRRCVEVFHTLKQVLKDNGVPATGVGDEGGYAPNLKEDEDALKVIVEAIKKANYIPNKDFKICIDAASSEWYDPSKDNYYLPKSKKTLTKEELVKEWERLISLYPILSIEDGMGETDYQGWKLLTDTIGSKVQLVGDDLFVTNKERLKEGIKLGIANAILIKVNQIGTLSETLETIKLAQEANYKVIISHRSGETEDTTIADLAVATNAEQIKSGAPSRSERVAKYNQLLRIEEKIGN
ncbi:MAG: phosphopyruvate hydratase [Erysipelotrichaceae bacterium]|nr:phosphopyruvate hydratase [Erysipelotrichaceae bacterium]